MDSKLSILYEDKDSLPINQLQFEILNDTLNIFKLRMVTFENDVHGHRSSIYLNSKLTLTSLFA